MTIGEALKKEQQNLGLTATEMAAGIISKGTYSKVVHNKARLSTDLLLKILFFHDVDLENFFNRTKDTYAPKSIILDETLSHKFGIAFNNHDLKKTEEYLTQIEKLSNNPYLINRAQIGVAFLTNNLKKLDPNLSELILKELNSHENWITDVEALKLFSNSMLVLPERYIESQMEIFFVRIKRIDANLENIFEKYAVICSNYLHWKYDLLRKRNAITGSLDQSNVANAIIFLKELNPMTQLMIYRISGKYYESLFSNNLDNALKIKLALQELGLKKLIQNWPV